MAQYYQNIANLPPLDDRAFFYRGLWCHIVWPLPPLLAVTRQLVLNNALEWNLRHWTYVSLTEQLKCENRQDTFTIYELISSIKALYPRNDLQSCVKTFLLSSENCPQNIPLSSLWVDRDIIVTSLPTDWPTNNWTSARLAPIAKSKVYREGKGSAISS